MMAQQKYKPGARAASTADQGSGQDHRVRQDLGCPAPLLRVAHEYFTRAGQSEWRDTDVASIFEIVAKEAGVNR